jgi:hypothetical protein
VLQATITARRKTLCLVLATVGLRAGKFSWDNAIEFVAKGGTSPGKRKSSGRHAPDFKISVRRARWQVKVRRPCYWYVGTAQKISQWRIF